MGHREPFAALKPSQEYSGLEPTRRRQGRRLDLARQPYDWLVCHDHGSRYVISDILAMASVGELRHLDAGDSVVTPFPVTTAIKNRQTGSFLRTSRPNGTL